MILLALVRPYNVLLPLCAIVAGWLVHKSFSIDVLWPVSAYFFMHSAVTLHNDRADLTNDELNHQLDLHTFIARHGRSTVTRLIIMFIAFSLITALVAGPWVLSLIVMGYVIAWTYNSPPLHGSYRPVVSMVLLGIGYGLLPILVGYGTMPSVMVIMLAGFWALTRVSLSLLKDYKDVTGDEAVQKYTTLRTYGHLVISRASLVLLLVGGSGIGAVSYALAPDLVYLMLSAGVLLWLVMERTQLLGETRFDVCNQIFHRCLHYQLVFDGVIILWLNTLRH